MCSQGNLAFTYGGVGRDQIQYGSTVEDEHIELVIRFIRTLHFFLFLKILENWGFNWQWKRRNQSLNCLQQTCRIICWAKTIAYVPKTITCAKKHYLCAKNRYICQEPLHMCQKQSGGGRNLGCRGSRAVWALQEKNRYPLFKQGQIDSSLCVDLLAFERYVFHQSRHWMYRTFVNRVLWTLITQWNKHLALSSITESWLLPTRNIPVPLFSESDPRDVSIA